MFPIGQSWRSTSAPGRNIFFSFLLRQPCGHTAGVSPEKSPALSCQIRANERKELTLIVKKLGFALKGKLGRKVARCWRCLRAADSVFNGAKGERSGEGESEKEKKKKMEKKWKKWENFKRKNGKKWDEKGTENENQKRQPVRLKIDLESGRGRGRDGDEFFLFFPFVFGGVIFTNYHPEFTNKSGARGCTTPSKKFFFPRGPSPFSWIPIPPSIAIPSSSSFLLQRLFLLLVSFPFFDSQVRSAFPFSLFLLFLFIFPFFFFFFLPNGVGFQEMESDSKNSIVMACGMKWSHVVTMTWIEDPPPFCLWKGKSEDSLIWHEFIPFSSILLWFGGEIPNPPLKDLTKSRNLFGFLMAGILERENRLGLDGGQGSSCDLFVLKKWRHYAITPLRHWIERSYSCDRWFNGVDSLEIGFLDSWNLKDWGRKKKDLVKSEKTLLLLVSPPGHFWLQWSLSH